MKEHDLPESIEFRDEYLEFATRQRRDDREHLDFAQKPLAPPIRLLDPALRCVGPAMRFEIELAVPHRHGIASRVCERGLSMQRVAERRRRCVPRLRKPLAPRRAARPLDLRRIRSPAAISPAIRLQVCPRAAMIEPFDVVARGGEICGKEIAVVVVTRREVRKHLGAVETSPAEAEMREAIRVRPDDLVRDECVEPRLRHDLRQTRRESKGVRQIEDALSGR